MIELAKVDCTVHGIVPSHTDAKGNIWCSQCVKDITQRALKAFGQTHVDYMTPYLQSRGDKY